VRYLIDTDHISLTQRPPSPELAAFVARCAVHPSNDIVFCVVSFHEQAAGAHSYITRAKSAAEVIRGYELMSAILRTYSARMVLPFDANSHAVFDRLTAAKVNVKTMDLRIAAVALANNLVVVTRNSADFAKVPGLTVEDWTR
jgi:tRNA(fMet)-specific endonuclease VapC